MKKELRASDFKLGVVTVKQKQRKKILKQPFSVIYS